LTVLKTCFKIWQKGKHYGVVVGSWFWRMLPRR